MLSILHRKILWFLIFIMLFAVKTFAQDAVDIAINQLGDEYLWGGSGPDSFDCSGLTSYSFRQIGIELPRTALEQSQVGDLVIDEPQRGDLLFFATEDSIPELVTHAGIYEAANTMIHAQWYDVGVVQSDISTNYWSTRFLFARRVSEEPSGPIALATDLIYPAFITVDQNNVYWTDEGVSIKKIPLNGGAISILKEGAAPPITNIAVDSSSVYWSETFGGGLGWINKIPIDKDPATPLDPPLASANQPYDIAIDSTHVYWTEKNSGTPSFVQVRKVPIDGGTVTTLTESLYGFFFTGIAIDNDSVYFAYLYPNSSVYHIAKVSKNGGTVTPLFSSSIYKTDVEVDSTHVYWIEITELVPGELVGEIKRIPIDGGQEDTLATGLNDPQWIVVDSENVYWTEFANGDPGAGAIKKASKSGGVKSTLKSDLNGPYDIAVDDNYVYWTEQGTDGTDGAIRKISKNAP